MHPLLRTLDEKIGSLSMVARECEVLQEGSSAALQPFVDQLKELRTQVAALTAELETDIDPSPPHVQRRAEINDQLDALAKRSDEILAEAAILQRAVCQAVYENKQAIYHQLASEIQTADEKALELLEEAYQKILQTFAIRDKQRLVFKNSYQIGRKLGLVEPELDKREALTPWRSPLPEARKYVQDFFERFSLKRTEGGAPGENLLAWFAERW